MKNPEKAKAAKDRAHAVAKAKKEKKEKEKNKQQKAPRNSIQVTHLNKVPLQVNTIKIGAVVIETTSSKIKIDDVLIEV